ncbi:MAG: hypothetical protein IKM32_01255 [Clostridia bacterium]|nr:hypothetical protein [Clostridia bacterium]MBR6783296.1 hypothetical protein [Clostridia bacterium]
MSPKELLYIEDALGHTKQIKTVCTDFAGQLGDTELSNFLQSIAQKQQQTFDRIYNLL